jgi:hypothetical protein
MYNRIGVPKIDFDRGIKVALGPTQSVADWRGHVSDQSHPSKYLPPCPPYALKAWYLDTVSALVQETWKFEASHALREWWNSRSSRLYARNKNFWKKCSLTSHYILSIWYDTDRIEAPRPTFPSLLYAFVAAETCLRSRCLATLGETERQQGNLIILLFSLLSYSRLMWSPLCSCVCIPPPPSHYLLNAWTKLYETWYVYHGNWAHVSGILHKFLPSVFVSVYVSLLPLQGNDSVRFIPSFGARQQLGKQVPAATNTSNNNNIAGRLIFYAVRVLSKESLWVCLCIPLSLLGNK